MQTILFVAVDTCYMAYKKSIGYFYINSVLYCIKIERTINNSMGNLISPKLITVNHAMHKSRLSCDFSFWRFELFNCLVELVNS